MNGMDRHQRLYRRQRDVIAMLISPDVPNLSGTV